MTPSTIPTLDDAELKAILLTVDGRGKAAKEAALTELLKRAARMGRLDADLMEDLKRP